MNQKERYTLYFLSFIVLVFILYIAGYNVMKAHQEKQEIMINNLIHKNLINKNLKLKYNNLNTNKKPVLDPGVGVINTPNWEHKVKHHTDYLHNNPLMYDEKVKILYNDL
tara:strand:+ start:1282 stop:1611 length:330 start_codon:yes stop_codon:yes gene_type:complete